LTTYNIEIDQGQMDKIQELLQSFPRDTIVAQVRAINRTIGRKRGGVKKIIADQIYSDVKIKKSFIFKQQGQDKERTFDDKKASLFDVSGRVTTSSANVPLIYYSNRAHSRKRIAKSIFVHVQRSRKKTKMKHAFIPQLDTSHKGLYVRSSPDDGSDRSIRQLYGSRLPDVLSNDETMHVVLRKADALLYKNLEHELDYVIRKHR
jgi:hypothetical protein